MERMAPHKGGGLEVRDPLSRHNLAPLPPPLHPLPPLPPLRCRTCSSALNSFSRIDFSALIWICPFCFQRNHFPNGYAGISETNLPAELYPDLTTIDYELSNQRGETGPIYLFVMDTCMIEEEMEFAKSELKRGVQMLPENAMVGFVSFGTQVQV